MNYGIISRYSVVFILIFGLIGNIATADFEYEWIADETHKGQESYTPVPPVHLDILGVAQTIQSSSSALVLQKEYNVFLNAAWTNSESYQLVNVFEQLDPAWVSPRQVPKSLWVKVPFNLPNNISIHSTDEGMIILISTRALKYAQPLIARIEGIKGKLFNKDLHGAVLRYLHAVRPWVLDEILKMRFGIEVRPGNISYEELTKHTTSDTYTHFEKFKDEEKIYLITMLGEFPDGMLKTPGLKYIVRRKDGLTHPLYPTAPAVAWPSAGYIEFMSSAFDGTAREFIYRLILHEKAHFLWGHLFDDQLKQDWIELGGWFEDPDDPNGWSTTDETRFVSDYAHNVNPNEDMAESISFYIMNPVKLQVHAPGKYKFIQDRIMHGSRYVSLIREDLTFRVYNLYPDYVYPAGVKRVYIKITGAPEEDKKIYVEVEIDSRSDEDTATGAYLRTVNGPFRQDFRLRPHPQNGSLLVSEGTIMSKHRKSGYWHCKYLKMYDQSGNIRITEPPNIGWSFYLDNPLEDISPPEYVEDSCSIEIAEVIKHDFGNQYNVKVTWKAVDDNDHLGLPRVDAVIDNPHPDLWVERSQGTYDIETKTAEVVIPIYDYHSNGDWELREIRMQDIARNQTIIPMVGSDLSVFIDTQDPDHVPAVLDVDDISVVATPTNIEYPNGETQVDITLSIKEEGSGIYHVTIVLRDALGAQKYYDFYYNELFLNSVNQKKFNAAYYRERLRSDAYITCQVRILLPVGSTPGIWGITDINITDYARNQSKYHFTTRVRFDVIDSDVPAAPTLIETELLQNYPNPCNPETWVPWALEKSSEVSLSIYSVEGFLIRTIDLGFQRAGRYQTKDKAIYWDGTNQFGDKVANGIYFYTLRTADTVRTRKLIVLK